MLLLCGYKVPVSSVDVLKNMLQLHGSFIAAVLK